MNKARHQFAGADGCEFFRVHEKWIYIYIYIYILSQNSGIQSLKIGREETMLNKIVSKFPGFMDSKLLYGR